MEEKAALALQWAYGVSHVRDGVVNLCNSSTERIFYVSSHTGVIQNLTDNMQTPLQGHMNPISCACASGDKSLIATADTGSDSLIVVWNTITAQPQLTIPNPHPQGTLCMDISGDGSLLVSLSKPASAGSVQEISLWDLTSSDPATSAITFPVPAGDTQVLRDKHCRHAKAWMVHFKVIPKIDGDRSEKLSQWPAVEKDTDNCTGVTVVYSVQLPGDMNAHTVVRFNSSDPTEIVSNGARRVFFWQSCLPQASAFKYYSPPLSSADFKQKIGAFTVSTFVPGTRQAITATADGDVVVWDEQGMSADVGTHATDRKAVKLMRIHSAAISVLTIVGDFLVSAASDGFVRFFDPMLRLVAWFEYLDAGPIVAVSFSDAPIKAPPLEAQDLDMFLCPDFVVGTSRSAIVGVDSNSFNGHDPTARKGNRLVQGMLTDIATCCAHPTQPVFVVLGQSGMQLWDMVQHTVLADRALGEVQLPTCALFSRGGDLLVVGASDGAVLILNAKDLSEMHRFRHTRTRVCRVSISSKGQHIAAATDDGHILLFFLVPYKHTMRWEYIGRSKAHYSPVVALQFGEAPSGATQCFSLSDDGRLCEFDLDASALETGVVLRSEVTALPGARPTAMCFTPPLAYYQEGAVDTLLVLTDSHYKVRLFNPSSGVTVGTYRGPAFGAPLEQLQMFKSVSSDNTYLAFRSNARTAGIMLWPVDGHPAKAMGMLAHPGSIASVSVSFDGRRLITAGTDGVVNQWDINTYVLDNAARAVNRSSKKWEQVVAEEADIQDVERSIGAFAPVMVYPGTHFIPGLEDDCGCRLFVYGQIRAQGEDTPAARKITDRLPLDRVPELMCALGYYPTQSEIHDMLSNIAYAAEREKQQQPKDIDFETFLYLYYNFKPVHGVLLEEIEQAFSVLSVNKKDKSLSADRLIEALTSFGDVMDEAELQEAMRLLTGKQTKAALPKQVTPQTFAADMLGLHVAET